MDKKQSATLQECLHKLGDAVAYMKNLSDEQFRRSDALIQQQNQVNALAARSRELENSLNQVIHFPGLPIHFVFHFYSNAVAKCSVDLT